MWNEDDEGNKLTTGNDMEPPAMLKLLAEHAKESKIELEALKKEQARPRPAGVAVSRPRGWAAGTS